MIKPIQDFWIQTADQTLLYYKVRAASAEEAISKFKSGEGEYVGCDDECNEKVRGVLDDKPFIAWK